MRSKRGLLRVLGLGFGLAAVVGSVVGQGILRSPGEVAAATSSHELIIALWVAGGLIAMLTAMPFAELGAAIPRAGGFYAYTHRAFGSRIGMLTALGLLFAYLAINAMLAFVTGEYLLRLGVGGGAWSVVELGIAVTALFAAINAAGTRITGGSQVVFSVAKGIFLLALVIALFGGPSAAPQSPADSDLLVSGWLTLGTAIMLIVSTYNGWWDLVFYGEELKDPGKQIPRSLFGGILAITIVYLLVNLAILHVVTPQEIAGSNFAAADAAGVVFGDQGDFLLTVFGVLSVGAIGNLALMTTSRIVFSLSRAGVLPQFMSGVDDRGTPMSAMLVTAATGALMILTGSYLALSSMGVAVLQVVIALTVLSAFALRRNEPDLPRPYLMPFYPWSGIFALFIALLLLAIVIAQDPYYSLLGIVVVAFIWLVFVYGLKREGTLEPIDSQEDTR